jgi:hypothetical protein
MDAVVASSLEIEQKHVLIDFIQSYAPLEESQRRDLNELLVDPKRENTMNFRKTMMQEAMEQGLEKGIEKGIEQEKINSDQKIRDEKLSIAIHAKKMDRECSPGTNIFWDHGYASICPEQHFTPAVHLVTRVISKPSSNRVCLDLGHKAVASENEITKRVYFPSNTDLKPVGQSEEHLVMEAEHAEKYNVGDILIGIPYHICPTVALHETLIAIDNDQIIGEWQVAARKRKINI